MSDADTDQHRLTSRPHLPPHAERGGSLASLLLSPPLPSPLCSPYLFRRTHSAFPLFVKIQRKHGEKPIQKHTHARPRNNNSESSRVQSMGAGKGGDDRAEEAAAAEPVVLKMELHCAGCAQKVKKAIKRVPGT